MKIASPKRTIEILQKYEFVFQKKYGQNFLIDLHVLDKIINNSKLTKEDVVIEVGPGIGSLTQALAESVKKVIAIEIDKKLIPILKDTLEEYKNVEIINNDILKVDLNELIQKENNGKSIKVIANLPYYITTPIIMGIFENNVNVDSITVMVQKEVGQRMQALPGTKEYGALSLAVQYYSDPYIVANVPPNCFMPRPKVGSVVINLVRNNKHKINHDSEKLLFEIIKAAFNQRRKTLVNSLYNSYLKVDKDIVIRCLNSLDMNEMIRGEKLSLEDFIKFTLELEKFFDN